jgi:hypothetical protein
LQWAVLSAFPRLYAGAGCYTTHAPVRLAQQRDDDVLQENIILLLERGCPQDDVTVSTSTDDSFTDLVTHTHPFDRIVLPDDSERFIHVPTSAALNAIELSSAVRWMQSA